jgi:flagellar basal-body rod protein FlgF
MRAFPLRSQFMDSIAVTAAAGLRSRMEALDLLSNNLANTSTSGYKADREFYSLYQSEEANLSSNELGAATLPHIKKQWVDFKQGTLQPTGNPLDLALTQKGFFAVNGPNGPLYTRNGAFTKSSTGVLMTTDGYAVRGAGGKPIQLDPGLPIAVSSSGSVQQGGEEVGHLEVVDFTDPSVLSKVGSNYFRSTDPKANPTPVLDPTVQQGQIEASNVSPAESAVRLVELMRQYEMLQKAVSVTADMNKRATDDVARVGS